MVDQPALDVDDDTDLDLLRHWRPSDWIGQGKTYGSDPPPLVLAARRQVLALLPVDQPHLPDPKLPISGLLKFPLQAQPSALAFEKAEIAFSNNPPTESLHSMDFRTRPIPPAAYIRKLEAAFGQAWFDGAQSIVDHRYKNCCLPLNVLTYWSEVSAVWEARRAWKTAEEWARGWAKELDIRVSVKEGLQQEEIRKVMDSLPWGADLRCIGAATAAGVGLASILSERWLNDDHINMFMGDLRLRMPLDSGDEVADLLFVHGLCAVYDREGSRNPGVILRGYEARAREGSLKRLYFPSNINGNHWVAFLVDFENETVSYGDSQIHVPTKLKAGSDVARILKAVCAWAKTALGRKLRVEGNRLERGQQLDGFSCGICCTNTIAHHILGDALFVHNNREALRLDYFKRLAHRLLEQDVSTCSCSLHEELAPQVIHANGTLRPTSVVPEAASSCEQTDSQPPSTADNLGKRTRSLSSEATTAMCHPTKRPATIAPTSVVVALPSDDTSSPDITTTPLATPATSPNAKLEPTPTTADIVKVPIDLGPAPRECGTNTPTIVPVHHNKQPPSRNTHGASSQEAAHFTGRSRSSLAAQKLKEAVAVGSFERNHMRNDTFLKKLAELDERAEVKDTKDGTYIWHSTCGRWFKTKDGGPYSLQLFIAHLKTCKPGPKLAKTGNASEGLGLDEGATTHEGESEPPRGKSQPGEKNDSERMDDVKVRETNRIKASDRPTQKNTLLPWAKKVVQDKGRPPQEKDVVDARSSSSEATIELTAGERSQMLPGGESRGVVAQSGSLDKPETQSEESSKPVLKTTTLLTWARKLGWSNEERAESKAAKTIRSHASVQDIRAPISSDAEAPPSTPSHSRAGSRCACQGLTGAADERVPIYVRQALASGGGSSSVNKISTTLFSQSFKTLTPKQKATVEATQQQERAWRNDIWAEAVFATSCPGFIESADDDGSVSCSHCLGLLKLHPFQTALSKAMRKKGKKVKHQFRNKRYRSDTLAALFARSAGLEALIMDESPDATAYKRLAVGLLEGKLSGYPIVGDLLRALAEQVDREERGVGRQNFKYGPTLNEFAHMAAIISPELYRILSKHLPLPDPRHLKRTENAVPPFPLTIQPETFDNVLRYLRTVKYTGPVSLSCDDTKLHATYRTYWDAQKEVHMLVGGTGEPFAVADVEELQRFLDNPTQPKATKIRLWCLQIPLPKIPPIIVAAKPIPNSLSVTELHELAVPILDGLLARGIPVRSYACDGTETERSLQRRITEHAPYRVVYTVEFATLPAGIPPLSVVIPMYHGHAIVIIQDAKHGLKTFRNNLFSGARLLVLGNYTAGYAYARSLAFHPDSPLYHRDVEKLDRQDDNAATRLFSPTALEFLVKQSPDCVGQIIYKFNMAELIASYINPELYHVVRLKMAFRTHFFLNIWRQYLRVASYAESRHFISREAADIARILVEGILGLVIVYRDYLGDATPTPLLPWLHSSEPCEHVFGEARKLVSDFTFLDFLYMIPRLHVVLRSLIKFSHTTNPKATAAGYAHDYFLFDRVDLAKLAVFPSDAEIRQAAEDAWSEAESLFALVGITPSDFLTGPEPPDDDSIRLPSLSSWYPNLGDSATGPSTKETSRRSRQSTGLPDPAPDSLNADSDALSEISSDEEDLDDSEDLPTQLESLIQAHDGAWTGRTNAEDERFLNLSCAAVALAMDDTVTAQSVVDMDEFTRQQDLDRAEIQRFYEHVSKIQDHLPAEPARPFERPLRSANHIDFEPLLTERRQHETPREARCVRVGKKHSRTSTSEQDSESPDGDGNTGTTRGTRRDLFREINSMIYKQQGRGVGSGLERMKRWMQGDSETPGAEPVASAAGNAANAALAAGQRASTVVSRRQKTFSAFKLPDAGILADGLVGDTNTARPNHLPLQPGQYCIVYAEKRPMVARVMQLQSRDGAKNGKHTWVASVKNIGLASYISMQLFEHISRNQFRAILRRMMFLGTYTFAHLSSDQFLRHLPGTHQLSPDGNHLYIDLEAVPVFEQYGNTRVSIRLRDAIKALTQARRKSGRKAGNKASAGSGSEADEE